MPDIPDDKCPRCGKTVIVSGNVMRKGAFRPSSVKTFSLSLQTPELWMQGDACACASCGLIWMQIDQESLVSKLKDLGTAEIKSELETIE